MELIEFNTRMEAALLEAKFRGAEALQNSMIQLVKTVNQLAQERLQMIEHGSLELIQKIDLHYEKMSASLIEENDNYMQNKLPSLAAQLDAHPEGSSAHTLFSKAIEQDITRNFDYQRSQLDALQQRQKSLIDSSLTAKTLIYEQSHTLVESQMQQLQQSIEQRFALAAPSELETMALPKDNTLLLEQE
ncbi:MAG: hypothetical protein Q9O24_07695 [Gammaproteobacteria bacterium]|nr:hypothetical protein [Gammaproteobacteria bacterium]